MLALCGPRYIEDELWMVDGTHDLCNLVLALEHAADIADRREVDQYTIPEVVTITHSRKHGWPRKVINKVWLEEAVQPNRRISITDIALVAGVNWNTIVHYLKEYGLTNAHDDITDTELDDLIKKLKMERPDSGIHYFMGFLTEQGVKVQWDRARLALRWIDAVDQALRQHRQIERIPYYVQGPNRLWHMDGHHKLIHWGIVIHGITDGFCCTITGMQASTNNKASMVMSIFQEAVKAYGLPSCVCGQPGTHASSIFGLRLELSLYGGAHLWLLHRLFLPLINEDLESFVKWWNAHPVSGPQAQNKSPWDMRFLALTTTGMHEEPAGDNVHPETLTMYYGIQQDNGTAQDNTDVRELAQQIAEDQDESIWHDAINVPCNGSPFPDSQQEQTFSRVLERLEHVGFVPQGYMATEEEWASDGYPEKQIICGGNRGKQEMEQTLPLEIWKPWAIQWAQALAAYRNVKAHFM
ncbi:hypothetical protein EW145_g1447 [Phellinidium pouzarii]|uniref:Integrase core domain-containing protein n=1 Tax=Phellinidium pouzarii TaxID=167371 RepID=A0A4S4LGD4_9AGAM|nr:hypothetical protein EW145_g1447 [Phellinidium pouzarii]